MNFKPINPFIKWNDQRRGVQYNNDFIKFHIVWDNLAFLGVLDEIEQKKKKKAAVHPVEYENAMK